MHNTNPANHDGNRYHENRQNNGKQRKESDRSGGRRGSKRPQVNDVGERDFNDLTREEIIALVKKVAEELGHRPNVFEFWQMARAKKEHIRRLFGSYRELVEEPGLRRQGLDTTLRPTN